MRRHHIPSEPLVQEALVLASNRHVHATWVFGTCRGAVLGVLDRRFKQTTKKVDAPTRARPDTSCSPGSLEPTFFAIGSASPI
ncbi:hypothetical protein PMIN01_06139 [Paraphaeosphaeria minitans]|uniref:Uncharacterized protein n=1 Tax=Paraphaeosphaeria minitans TaxID=565426 RepID=A0A9P6KS18_9PLEO|nr:hypothetical protein PMIN01_06139 [Paraphaeosphaeria minitans]